MGYNYSLSKYYKVVKAGEYPWPCKAQPNRTIEIFEDDVLSKTGDGEYFKQTGLGCMGIHIPDSDVVLIEDPITLRIN